MINRTRQALEGMDTIKDNLLVQDSATIQIGQYQETAQRTTATTARHIEILHEYLHLDPDDYQWAGVFGGTPSGDPTPQWLGGEFYHAPPDAYYPKVGESYDGYPFGGGSGFFENGAESVSFPEEIPSRWWGSEQKMFSIKQYCILRNMASDCECVFAKMKVTGQVVSRLKQEITVYVDSFPFDYQTPGGVVDPIKNVRLDRNLREDLTPISIDPTTLSLSFALAVQKPNILGPGALWSVVDGSYSTPFTTNGVEQTVDLANTFNKFLELRGGPYKDIKVFLVAQESFEGYPDETGWEEDSFTPGTGIYVFKNTVTREKITLPNITIGDVIFQFALKEGKSWKDVLPGSGPMGPQPSM